MADPGSPEGDSDVLGEEPGEVDGQEAHDSFPADHVIGHVECDGCRVPRRRSINRRRRHQGPSDVHRAALPR